jgi:GDPmannose 4,6-dehydratase
MHEMLQMKSPDDYVISTGEAINVRTFAIKAFAVAGLECEKYIEHDKSYHRPSEVHCLLGNPSRARIALAWQPTKTIDQIIEAMVRHDINLAVKERDS